MTFKRDIDIIHILSRLLERAGCECLIVTNYDFFSISPRLWRPDAIFFVTPNKIQKIIEYYPGVPSFLFAAEGGGLDVSDPEETPILNNNQWLDAISKIYIWGEGTRKLIDKIIDNNSAINRDYRSKIVLAGYPKLDVIKYYNPTGNTGRERKIKIGFIGNFFFINNVATDGYLMRNILNRERVSLDAWNMVENMVFQLKLLNCYHQIMNKLDPCKYSFSIRPYPLENMKSYHGTRLIRTKNVDIDNSLSFSTWLKEHDILIGTISTTVYQVAIAGKAYINMDVLFNRPERPFDASIRTALKNNTPKDMTQLYDMIENYETLRLDKSDLLNEQLKEFFNFDRKGSVLLDIANDIVDTLDKKNTKPSTFRIPTAAAKIIFDLKYLYSLLRDRNNFKQDYSFFRYASIIPQARRELDPIFESIVKENPEKSAV
jgi:surface carbohydrate biosynthesis protein